MVNALQGSESCCPCNVPSGGFWKGGRPPSLGCPPPNKGTPPPKIYSYSMPIHSWEFLLELGGSFFGMLIKGQVRNMLEVVQADEGGGTLGMDSSVGYTGSQVGWCGGAQ